MAEYISREAIKQVLCGIANGLSVEETKAFKTKGVKALSKIKGAKEILNAIDNDLSFIPATDVQPVKRGRWLLKFDGDIYEYRECSKCGNTGSCETPYCAQCGARMDLKDGDTDA